MFGRTAPNMAADVFGAFNVTIPINIILVGLAFAMYGVTSSGALVVFSFLYGCISGACENYSCLPPIISVLIFTSVVSLVPPLNAAFARDLDEVGFVDTAAYCV